MPLTLDHPGRLWSHGLLATIHWPHKLLSHFLLYNIQKQAQAPTSFKLTNPFYAICNAIYFVHFHGAPILSQRKPVNRHPGLPVKTLFSLLFRRPSSPWMWPKLGYLPESDRSPCLLFGSIDFYNEL